MQLTTYHKLVVGHMYRVLSNIMHHNTGVRTTERDIRLQMVQVGGKGRGREGRCRREGKGGRREERAMRNPTRPLPPRRWWTCGGCSGTPCCIPLNPKFPPPPPTQVVDLRQWLRDHLLYLIDESQVDMQEVPASQRLAEVGGGGGPDLMHASPTRCRGGQFVPPCTMRPYQETH